MISGLSLKKQRGLRGTYTGISVPHKTISTGHGNTVPPPKLYFPNRQENAYVKEAYNFSFFSQVLLHGLLIGWQPSLFRRGTEQALPVFCLNVGVIFIASVAWKEVSSLNTWTPIKLKQFEKLVPLLSSLQVTHGFI
jgi:hypothetical protein